MTKPYETRILSMIVSPEGDGLLSEMVTRITIEDEGAGEFVSVTQDVIGKIQLGAEEWPAIRAAIDSMLSDCRPLQILV